MQILHELRIREVSATIVTNAPFRIECEGNPFSDENRSSLVLNRIICERYSIPMSVDIAGRILICLFESRELPLEKEGHFKDAVDQRSLGDDDLGIKSLERKEVISPMLGLIPPANSIEIYRILRLSSFGGDDMCQMMPCPFYRFTLELTEDEYETCKALAPSSKFEVSFCLKA
jgi:hypothetical protein